MAIIMAMSSVAAAIAMAEASAKMRFMVVNFFLATKFLSFQLPRIPNYYGLLRAQKRSILTKIDVSNLFFGGTEKIVELFFCWNSLQIPT